MADWIGEAEGDRSGAVTIVDIQHVLDHGGVRGPSDEVTGNFHCQRHVGIEILAECQEQIVVYLSVDVDAPNSDTECGGVGG